MTDRPERANDIDQAGGAAPGSLAARYGRRALMLGAAAAGAGVAASLVGGGLAEAAPDSGSVQLGKTNTTGPTTRVVSRSGTGVSGHAATAGQAGIAGYDLSKTKKGFGVYGQSENGVAVNGISKNNNGVVGNTSAIGFAGVAGIDFTEKHTPQGVPTQGVYGQSNFNAGVTGVSFGGTGIAGNSRTPGYSGVEGVNTASHGGFGVTAVSNHGTALFGNSTHGLGLHVNGKVKFSSSGVVFIDKGQKSKTISVSGMTTSMFVLATPQAAESGVYVLAAQPGSGSLTITLSQGGSADVPVAWFALGE
jgi:hypothetical protein